MDSGVDSPFHYFRYRLNEDILVFPMQKMALLRDHEMACPKSDLESEGRFLQSLNKKNIS